MNIQKHQETYLNIAHYLKLVLDNTDVIIHFTNDKTTDSFKLKKYIQQFKQVTIAQNILK